MTFKQSFIKGLKEKFIDHSHGLIVGFVLASIGAAAAFGWGKINQLYLEFTNISHELALTIAKRNIDGAIIYAQGVKVKDDENQYIVAYVENFRTGKKEYTSGSAVLLSSYGDSYKPIDHLPAFIHYYDLTCFADDPQEPNCENTYEGRTARDVLAPFFGVADVDGDGNNDIYIVELDYSTGESNVVITVLNVKAGEKYTWTEESNSHNWLSAERIIGFSENIKNPQTKAWLKRKSDEFYWSGGSWDKSRADDYRNGLLIKERKSVFDNRYVKWLENNGRRIIRKFIIANETEGEFWDEEGSIHCEIEVNKYKWYVKFKEPGVQVYDNTSDKNYVVYVPSPEYPMSTYFIVGKNYIWLSAFDKRQVSAIKKDQFDLSNGGKIKIELFEYQVTSDPAFTANEWATPENLEESDADENIYEIYVEGGALKYGNSLVTVKGIDMKNEFSSAKTCQAFQ